MRGLEYPNQLEITIDGARVHLASFGGDADFKAQSRQHRPQRATRSKRACTRASAAHSRSARNRRGVSRGGAPRTRSGCSRLSAASNDTLDPSGRPHVLTFTVTGPFNATGPGRHAQPPPDLHLPSRDSAPSELACARRFSSTLARRAYRGRCTDADLEPLHGVLRPPAGARARSTAGIELALRAHARQPEVPLPRRARSRRRRARHGRIRISDLELASRLSFFLWSSIPDDELLDAGRAGQAARPGGARRSRSGACSPIRRRDALVTQLRRSVAAPAQPAQHDAELGRLPGFRRQPAPGVPARKPSCSSTASCAKIATSLDLMTADYTFVNERLAKHYGIPDVYGSHFRRVTLTDEAPQRAARAGQHPDRDVACRPHVAGGARQVDSRQPAGHAAAAAAAQRAAAQGERRRRQDADDARADGGAPREPGLRQLPQIMDPIGFALENFDAVGAWRTATAARWARRSTRRASCSTARRSTASSTLRKAS